LNLFPPLVRRAVFSPCNLYRYSLHHEWALSGPHALFIMLNPSTATHLTDDPTIRRCREFAKRFGCGGMEIGNVYGYRSTDPAGLALVNDPVGEATDDYLLRALEVFHPVVLAWGAVVTKCPGWQHRLEDLVRMVRGALNLHNRVERRCAYHLGEFTKDGHPRHPLYLREDSPLNRLDVLWKPPK
jgi:hypothetical protein